MERGSCHQVHMYKVFTKNSVKRLMPYPIDTLLPPYSKGNMCFTAKQILKRCWNIFLRPIRPPVNWMKQPIKRMNFASGTDSRCPCGISAADGFYHLARNQVNRLKSEEKKICKSWVVEKMKIIYHLKHIYTEYTGNVSLLFPDTTPQPLRHD
jgi:hypothetical protein